MAHFSADDVKLANAVAMVGDLLLEGETPAQAVADAAEEFGLPAQRVQNRFTVQMGKAPAEWQAATNGAKAAVAQAAESNAAEALAKAQQAARNYAARNLRMPWEAERLLGKPFTYEGKQYVFIALIRGCPTWVARAVRVEDGAFRKLNRAAWNSVAAQVMG